MTRVQVKNYIIAEEMESILEEQEEARQAAAEAAYAETYGHFDDEDDFDWGYYKWCEKKAEADEWEAHEDMEISILTRPFSLGTALLSAYFVGSWEFSRKAREVLGFSPISFDFYSIMEQFAD